MGNFATYQDTRLCNCLLCCDFTWEKDVVRPVSHEANGEKASDLCITDYIASATLDSTMLGNL